LKSVFVYASFWAACPLRLGACKSYQGTDRADRVIGVDAINTFVICMMVLFGAAYHEILYIDMP
jgi:multisubunit Na+/H+ antiporter MnhF subunit